jgi:putative acetyltransferase
MQIRLEQPSDIARIRQVNLAAFDTATEANLVDALRDQARPVVSLVAEDAGDIVGHIMFSPVTLSTDSTLRLMGLSPMAVLPSRQRQGIGSALVREGIDRCRRMGCAAIALIGHAAFYPRFGFVPASRFGLFTEYEVPDDVFMVLELEAGVLRRQAGTIRYHAAFASAG